MKTLSQRRAEKALHLLSGIRERGDKRKEFTQFCKAFPTMIIQNGLGQSLAFIRAKAQGENGGADDRYSNMYKTLNSWLKELNLVHEDTLTEIMAMDAKRYVEIQTESLRFLEWIKRFENAGIYK